MDTSGHLRQMMNEDLMTMEDIVDPVEDVSDIPEIKLNMFKLVDQQGNRKARQAYAKSMEIDWSEYQVYRHLKNET